MIMKIYRKLVELDIDRPTAVTVGSFDGLHRGHQKILDTLNQKARECGCLEVLVTFHPHPKLVVGPPNTEKPQFLTTLDEKLQLLQQMDVPVVLIIPFTKKFSQTGYREFVRDILVDRLQVKQMVIGHDHTFGRNREGHPEQLQETGKQFGFKVTVVEPFYLGDHPVSSTRIRTYLQKGNIEETNKMLGRRYSLSGQVVRGSSRGQELGFPTANLRVNDPHKLSPAIGIYAVDVIYRKRRYSGMMSIGHRPTFNFDPLTLEVHIFNFKNLIYGSSLTIEFKKYIREEKKFDNVEQLKEQMKRDKEMCINF